MKLGAIHFLILVLLLFQGCGTPSQDDLSESSTSSSMDEDVCNSLNRVVHVLCGPASAQLSVGGNKDAPIYGAAEFASVPIFGFCNRGEYPRAEVQARLYRGSQLIVKSPFVTCTGTYNTSLPTAGVSRHEDYTLEIEIVGVTKEGRRFTNLPLSRSRTFYPAEE